MNSKFRNLSNVFYFIYNSKKNLGRVAQWLATCAQKPEVPGLSPVTSYIHGNVLSVCEVGGKSGREELELVFLFAGCSVTGESQLKENPNKRKGFFTFRRKSIGCWKRNLLKRNWRRRRRFVVVFQVCLAGSWYPIRDLVRFTQCKKRTKYCGRSVTFSKIAVFCSSKSNTFPWMFFTFFKLYKRYQIEQSITYRQKSVHSD